MVGMRRATSGFALLVVTNSGCAAVFKGGHQEVDVVAIPEGADVRLNGQFMGATPTKANVDRINAGNLVVSKDGFKEQYLTLQRHADTPWWIWDIATCAIPILLCIPLGVDALSGAWFSYDETVRVKLDPLPSPPPPTFEKSNLGY